MPCEEDSKKVESNKAIGWGGKWVLKNVGGECERVQEESGDGGN